MSFLSLEDFQPGNEVANIATHTGYDRVVYELIDVVEKVKGLILEGHEDPNDKIYTPIYKKIEKILTDRFGCIVKLNPNTGSMYACEIVGPIVENGVVDIKSIFKNPSNFLGMLFSVAGLTDKLEQWIKFSKFNSYLENNQIKVNLQESRFENWPKENEVRIFWDVVDTVSTFVLNRGKMVSSKLHMRDLSPADVVAPVIHEMGHAFTFISSLYQTRRNRIALEDTVRDQIKKGVDREEAFYIGFQKAIGKDIPELKNKKKVHIKDVFLAVTRSEMYKYQYGSGLSSQTDAEFSADQFAARLGLSVELSKFLDTVHSSRNWLVIELSIISSLLTFLLILALYGPGAVIYNLGIFFFGLLIFLITGRLTGLLLKSAYTTIGVETYPYDLDLRRIQRIRLDVIRQIRTSKDLPEDVKKRRLRELDTIADICATYTSWLGFAKIKEDTLTKIPILNLIGRYGTTAEMDQYEKLIEQNMENELHVSNLRF